MRALRIIRKNWIAVWLILVIFMLASVGSYAAYTGTTTAKRVISLSNRDGILFSSRYMSKSGTDMQPILFNYPDDTTPATPSIMIDVCNYDANSNVYGSDFSYKLKARIVHNDGTEITSSDWNAISPQPTTYKISYQSVSSGLLSSEYLNGLSSTELVLTNTFQYVPSGSGQEYQFKGSDKTRYLFKAEFDVNDIINANSAYGIEIVAEVLGQHSDLSHLSGKLRVIKGGAATESTWNGKYMDDTVGRNPEDYDGINYQLSGNAVGTVRLTYRSDCIEMDKDCYALLAPSDSTTTTQTIGEGEGSYTVSYTTLTIAVDPTEKESIYDLYFYWKNGPVSSVGFNDDFIQITFST